MKLRTRDEGRGVARKHRRTINPVFLPFLLLLNILLALWFVVANLAIELFLLPPTTWRIVVGGWERDRAFRVHNRNYGWLICRLFYPVFPVTVIGGERVPPGRPVLFASNHRFFIYCFFHLIEVMR